MNQELLIQAYLGKLQGEELLAFYDSNIEKVSDSLYLRMQKFFIESFGFDELIIIWKHYDTYLARLPPHPKTVDSSCHILKLKTISFKSLIFGNPQDKKSQVIQK